MAFVKGRISVGNTTFWTRPELLLMLFRPLFSASEKVRKGSSPQYRKRPKLSVGSPSTDRSFIPNTWEKMSARKKTQTRGPSIAHTRPR
jgi:hypothetical protein